MDLFLTLVLLDAPYVSHTLKSRPFISIAQFNLLNFTNLHLNVDVFKLLLFIVF